MNEVNLIQENSIPPAPRTRPQGGLHDLRRSRCRGSHRDHPVELVKSVAAGRPRDGGNLTHRLRSELRPFGLPVACRNRRAPSRIPSTNPG